ncbi:Serine/threonine protein kinase [Nonomuraea solani]|uniref:non-specific serine/threonine protein kinase n=1 Tax=Nonomuraea solani TaxID=1144553 RepID=A0A1H6EYP5_9ACTN|nr:serine/threonine-protein kinase [Nonomuraea solani]SEH03028.1 Serine/threonine protein kinase [Nonomuraea solani]
MIGERVAGRFVIEAQLGTGGMGRVWRGRDGKLDRVVALKQVRADVGRLPELTARAEQEARALARIDHPGIVRVHDVLDAPDGPWIVMDYVRGTVLGALIEQSPLPEHEVARIGAQAVAALAAAHAVGVFHRDVKPDNILITASGEVVLVDFGIAAIEGHGRLTALGQVIGTPDFIAPERLRGIPVDGAADLWSLGATLYTALEGRPPFHRSTSEATKFAILALPPDPMTRAAGLKSTINRLLAKSPANRMTAAELAHRLRQPPRRAPVTVPRQAPAPQPPPPPLANGGHVRRTIAGAEAAERGSMILALPAAEAAILLAQQWQLFTTAAVEELCRDAAKSAKILQMLLPYRVAWLLDQVRDPNLVAGVVLAMDPHHRGRMLGHMHDRHSAAALEAMATIDTRQTGLAVAAMPEGPAGQALTRLPSATIAALLMHCPPSSRDRLLSLLPSTTREDVARRLAPKG